VFRRIIGNTQKSAAAGDTLSVPGNWRSSSIRARIIKPDSRTNQRFSEPIRPAVTKTRWSRVLG
jgi:hypothetical protein